VDLTFDLCHRQLQHECRLLRLLIVDNGADREQEFDATQITELLRRIEFAGEGLALVSSYGKTKVQQLESPFGCGLETYKTERVFPDAGRASSAAAAFFRFSKILFLEVYTFELPRITEALQFRSIAR